MGTRKCLEYPEFWCPNLSRAPVKKKQLHDHMATDWQLQQAISNYSKIHKCPFLIVSELHRFFNCTFYWTSYGLHHLISRMKHDINKFVFDHAKQSLSRLAITFIIGFFRYFIFLYQRSVFQPATRGYWRWIEIDNMQSKPTISWER